MSDHQDKGRKRNKGEQDKKARTNCGNCGGDGHWWLECTETTGKPLKPELERRKKERAQGRQPPASLVNSVRVVQVAQYDDQSRGLFAGLSLTSTPSIAESMDLTCNEQPAVPPSPTCSATTPTSDDECKESEPPQAVQAAQAAQAAESDQSHELRQSHQCLQLLSRKCNKRCSNWCRRLCSASGRTPDREERHRRGNKCCSIWAKD
ncbi:hypothetical protein PR002_g6809 [Phytophthora rubi]|uniref:CCHC-type domain-containing protein n=1 Tax=Phytophthora rubi TaxID=129364 RepID=A0A6A3N5R6_9STRA|nr:hypothetical protein PR002_g6809 [Phytophthora rubi]